MALAGLLLAGPSLAVAGSFPPSEQILPATTRAWGSIADPRKMRERFNRSAMGRLLHDPLLSTFLDSLRGPNRSSERGQHTRFEITLEELDSHKKGMSEVARNARQVSREMDALATDGSLDPTEGIPLAKTGHKDAGGKLYFQTMLLDVQLPAGLLDGPALLFYPGSSIGNFSPGAALRLLRQARVQAAGGALLIGVDRLKPVALLEAAYDDELGVTAAFNLNLLNHLNRLLGSDFQPRQWRHVALFNQAESRVEMHLEARAATTVRWPGAARQFAAGERIHTENSHKWTPEAFAALLRDAGFTRVQHWTDAQDWFSVCLASG
mgnify:CR=1 FL=1